MVGCFARASSWESERGLPERCSQADPLSSKADEQSPRLTAVRPRPSVGGPGPEAAALRNLSPAVLGAGPADGRAPAKAGSALASLPSGREDRVARSFRMREKLPIRGARVTDVGPVDSFEPHHAQSLHPGG